MGYSGPKPAAGAVVEVQIAGRGGVPASGASAVVFTLTAAEADGPGFVTAWPTGQPQPFVSALNVDPAVDDDRGRTGPAQPGHHPAR